jgi:hypothetical protein
MACCAASARSLRQGQDASQRKIHGKDAGLDQNRYGYGRPHAIVLAMRYVIVIAAITFFLIWDGLYNQGRYLDTTVREVKRVVRYVTG